MSSTVKQEAEMSETLDDQCRRSPSVIHQSQSASKLLVLLCVSIPSFMINLDANIVAVSLPSIAYSLRADFASIEWVISAYTLTFACLVLPAGALADRYGRKVMLLCGLAVFTLASLFCGAASSAAILNGARAMQGVGAALQLSAALAILSHEFRGPQRARAFAFWGSVIGVAITLGPMLGGLITQSLGWEWAFYVNIPVGLVMIGLTLYAVRNSKDPGSTSIDIPGSFTFTGALFLVMLALISGNHMGWQDGAVLAEFAGAALLFAAFLAVEAKQARPMLDLALFRHPTYIGANITGFAFAASLLTMLTYLPLYFQGGLGVSPQKAGLMMMPIAAPLFVVPRLVAKYATHRVSGRALLTLGLILIGVGLLWLGVFAPQLRYSSMLAGMLVAGIGAGVLNGETAKVSMTVVPLERAGMASGVSGTIRFTGIAVGFAALGVILSWRVTNYLDGVLPPGSNGIAIAQKVVAGDLAGAALGHVGERAVIYSSFAAGYQGIFLVGAALAFLAAFASGILVRSSDTAPVSLSLHSTRSCSP